MIHSKKILKSDLFFYILMFTCFFLLAEISYFIQTYKIFFCDFYSNSKTFNVPISILPGVLFTVFVQISFHLIFSGIVWLLTCLLINNSFLQTKQPIFIAIFIWTLAITTVCLANQVYFPNSIYSVLTRSILPQALAGYVLFSLFILDSLVFILALLVLIRIISFRYLVIVTILISTCVLCLNYKTNNIISNVATKDKPNIFLIGVDSLRPDFLSYFADTYQTKFIDSFLKQATIFTEAITPIARTFPSWMSILSGQYPKQNGIRTNLTKLNNLHKENLLPYILQKNGYETAYASDETRFSNITTDLGFDSIITPPMGLNDFLIGNFNDFPLSNLVINNYIFKWLFPYNYGNRAAFYSYQPNSFLSLLKPFLNENRNKPLFFAIHFCLPHHPYLWASNYGYHLNIVERYRESVVRVDQQVADFFSLLKTNHLLDHAIVVLLSDHGEAFELTGDRITEKDLFQEKGNIPQFYPPNPFKENVNQSAGHGTDVLSLTQYHTVLAFSLYGMPGQQAKLIPGIVSVLDVKPTILQFLNIKSERLNGQSLAPVILGQKKQVSSSHFFLETDFTPESLRTIYPEQRKTLNESIEYFQVDPILTRLTIKDNLIKMIIDSKQFAYIYNEWMLALYPHNKQTQTPILINLQTGEWTNNLNSRFAQHSPAAQMLNQLRSFYGNEIKNISGLFTNCQLSALSCGKTVQVLKKPDLNR